MRDQKDVVGVLIEADAKSFAQALGVTVDELKNTKVSLYDIIAVRHEPEVLRLFSNARSVFRTANYYIVKKLLNK